MKTALSAIALLLAFQANAATTHNDDSCDIALLPAATLLLPYFEVDINKPQAAARTTLFTVVNTSQYPQIASVTLWSDWAYPVLNFNIFLTGYDVQSINLYDLLGPRGFIPSQSGQPGPRSLPNNSNPNFAPGTAADCAAPPGPIPASLAADIRSELTTGRVRNCGNARIGGEHLNAAGYATIDVVATCGSILPTEPGYFDQILYDNVLTGDWQIIDPDANTGNFAGGSPLVHIRAIPEGGPAGIVVPTNLPYTFYDRYTPRFDRETPAMDRRQPLPSAFAARYVQGFLDPLNTNFMLWREGLTGANAACDTYFDNSAAKRLMLVRELIRFDEHENPTTNFSTIIMEGYDPNKYLPATSSVSTAGGLFPPMSTRTTDIGGWIYLNLANPGSAVYTTKVAGVRPSQNWVVVSMSAAGRYSTLFDATMLANGCTSAAPFTGTNEVPIGPGPNTRP